MAILTLAQVKAHLRITTPSVSPLDAEDTDILLKMEQAEAIVLDYLKFTDVSPAVWTAETVPYLVQCAMLYQVGELYRFRGDDAQGQGAERNQYGSLSPWAEGVLMRYRDPTLA